MEFYKHKPGLVGGHCIGVDPYYLTHKAEEMGYHPEVILAGRKINDGMGKYIAEQTVKRLIEAGKTVKGAKIIVFGITFKENVSDIRNSRIIDIIRELKEYGIEVTVCDALADKDEVKQEYNIDLTEYNPDIKADGIVIAVNHNTSRDTLTIDAINNHLSSNGTKGVVIDVKGVFNQESFKNSGIIYWRL